AEREIRDAADEILRREQLLRRVERSGRQHVDLADERRARKEIRRGARRRTDRVAEKSRLTEGGVRRRVGGEELDGNRRVFQNAAARVAQTPGRLAVVIVSRAAGAGRRACGRVGLRSIGPRDDEVARADAGGQYRRL